MTATRVPAGITLAAVKRRMRDPDPDPVQVRADRDWLVGRLERRDEDVAALQAALMELAQLAADSAATLQAVKVVARQVARDKSLDGSKP
jgi:hypothetical protein